MIFKILKMAKEGAIVFFVIGFVIPLTFYKKYLNCIGLFETKNESDKDLNLRLSDFPLFLLKIFI